MGIAINLTLGLGFLALSVACAAGIVPKSDPSNVWWLAPLAMFTLAASIGGAIDHAVDVAERRIRWRAENRR
jgi:hypothetical protein